LMTYMAFVNEFIQAIDQQEQDAQNGNEPEPIDWSQIGAAVKAVLPNVLLTSFLEWVTDGIRIHFARHIYDDWNRRTVWKWLKGVPPAC
jgi:hypothetical protein